MLPGRRSISSAQGIAHWPLAVQICALAIGVPGHVSFLLSVARVPYMRTITNIFLVSLSIADVTFLVFTVTSYLLYLPAPVRSHIHSLLNLSCTVSFSVAFLTYFASVGTVWLVSAERYSAICHPLRHIVVHNKRRAVKLVLATWAVSCALTALAVLQYISPDKFCVTWPDDEDTDKFIGLPDIIGFCLPLAPWALIVGNLTASLPLIIALLANAFMYVQIIRTLGGRTITKSGLPGKGSKVCHHGHDSFGTRSPVCWSSTERSFSSVSSPTRPLISSTSPVISRACLSCKSTSSRTTCEFSPTVCSSLTRR